MSRRFLAHGPDSWWRRSNAGASDGSSANPAEIPFALATIPRPEPHRARIQADGTLALVLVHKERFARRRRYLVRPFGRYDNLVSAWHAAHASDKHAIPWVARRELSDLAGRPIPHGCWSHTPY